MSEEKKNEVLEQNELSEAELDGVSGGAFADVDQLNMGRTVLRTNEDTKPDGPLFGRTNLR